MSDRSIWKCWLVALVLGTGWPCPAAAEADGPDYFAVTGVAADDVLNIRDAPSAGGGKIGAIPPDGRHIRNLGCQGAPSFAEWEQMSEPQRRQASHRRWCRVGYAGIEGWVAGRYLKEDGP